MVSVFPHPWWYIQRARLQQHDWGNFLSELTLNHKRGQGTVTAKELGEYISYSAEQLQIRLDQERQGSFDLHGRAVSVVPGLRTLLLYSVTGAAFCEPAWHEQNVSNRLYIEINIACLNFSQPPFPCRRIVEISINDLPFSATSVSPAA